MESRLLPPLRGSSGKRQLHLLLGILQEPGQGKMWRRGDADSAHCPGYHGRVTMTLLTFWVSLALCWFPGWKGGFGSIVTSHNLSLAVSNAVTLPWWGYCYIQTRSSCIGTDCVKWRVVLLVFATVHAAVLLFDRETWSDPYMLHLLCCSGSPEAPMPHCSAIVLY